MSDEKREISPEVLGQVETSRRHALKVILGGVAVYSAPVIASFSMDGLRIDSAEARAVTFNETPGNFFQELVRAILRFLRRWFGGRDM